MFHLLVRRLDQIYRIARGLPLETPKDKLEILAEAFDGRQLTEQDWNEIEAVVKTIIEQKKRVKNNNQEG